MAAVTHPSTHGTDAHTVHHTASVAVVPMLVHEFLLGQGEGAQFVAHAVLILQEEYASLLPYNHFINNIFTHLNSYIHNTDLNPYAQDQFGTYSMTFPGVIFKNS